MAREVRLGRAPASRVATSTCSSSSVALNTRSSSDSRLGHMPRKRAPHTRGMASASLDHIRHNTRRETESQALPTWGEGRFTTPEKKKMTEKILNHLIV